MGCGASSTIDDRHVFVPNEKRPGQGMAAQRDFARLGLTKQTVDRFFTLFLTMDKDGTGVIDLDEFYRFFGIERSPFADRVFSIMDDDASGEISFREFVICLWNYLSLDIKALMRFCFDLFDQDLSGYLDVAEVHELLREVYGDSFETNDRLSMLMEELDANGDGRLSFEEFQEMNISYPSMLFPTFRIQQVMRDKVFGAAFWSEALKRRIKMGAGATATIWEITAAVDDARKMQSADELGGLTQQRWQGPMEGPHGYRPKPRLTHRGQKSADVAREELLYKVQQDWKQYRERQSRRKKYHDAAKAAQGEAALKALATAPKRDDRTPASMTAVASTKLRTTTSIVDSGLGKPSEEATSPTALQKRLQRVLAFDS